MFICGVGDAVLSAYRNLASFHDREICCYSVSCKDKDNIGMKNADCFLHFTKLFVTYKFCEMLLFMLCSSVLIGAAELWDVSFEHVNGLHFLNFVVTPGIFIKINCP